MILLIKLVLLVIISICIIIGLVVIIFDNKSECKQCSQKTKCAKCRDTELVLPCREDFLNKYKIMGKGKPRHADAVNIENIKKYFNLDGSFKVNKYYDPFRFDDTDRTLSKFHENLFDENGCAILDSEQILGFIRAHNCDIGSDIVNYYFSRRVESACHGNYTAIYFWR